MKRQILVVITVQDKVETRNADMTVAKIGGLCDSKLRRAFHGLQY